MEYGLLLTDKEKHTNVCLWTITAFDVFIYKSTE